MAETLMAPIVLGQPSTVSARNLPEAPSVVDASKVGTVDALVPIVRLEENLALLARLCSKDHYSADIEGLLDGIPTVEKTFKSIFDAYSDPVSYKQKFVDQNAFLVYYSKGFDGPGRASIEDDLPVKQTIQYGTRNEAWIAWNDFLVELDYARSHPNDSDTDDLVKPLSAAAKAVDAYLAQAPPIDVQAARNFHG